MRGLYKLATIAALSLLFSINVCAQTYSGDTWAEAQEKGTANVTAVYLAEDAFAYENENGQLTGVEIDIFQQFCNFVKNAKGVEVNVEYVKETSFSKFYKTVQNSSDGVFGLGSTTILERRKSEVQFSPPFINNIAILVTHESAPNLSSLDEIAELYSDKIAAVAEGTTLEGYMENLKQEYFPSLKIERFPTQISVIEKVAEDPDYFSYSDLSVYWPYYQNPDYQIKRQEVADLAAEVFGFIMPLSSDWQPVMEEFFNLGSGYRSMDMYRNILVKHLGAEYTQMLEIARQKTNQ
jgi:putative glutamine transport system substrate-binding protein